MLQTGLRQRASEHNSVPSPASHGLPGGGEGSATRTIAGVHDEVQAVLRLAECKA